MANEKPVRKFRAGRISAAIFENTGKNGERYPSVVLQRTYNHGDEWKHTNSLRMNDLPKACFVLEQAYAFLTQKEEGSPA